MRSSSEIDVMIMQLAAPSGGVVHCDAIRAAGIPRQQVSQRVRAGWMRQVHPRVYAVGPAAFEMGEDARIWAALLAGGPGSALARSTAAARLDIWKRAVEQAPVQVIIPRHRRPPRTSGVRFHRARRAFGKDVIDHDGIPTTHALRCILDLRLEFSWHQLTCIIDRAVFLRKCTARQLTRRIELLGGAPGSMVLHTALACFQAGSVGSRSLPEEIIADGLESGSFPRYLLNVRGATGIPGFEYDFVFPTHRHVVELDGRAGHELPGVSENDRRKESAAVTAGCTFQRFPAQRVLNDAPYVLHEIAAALAVARSR